MKLLGISGSLRRESTNTALLHALTDLLPGGVEFSVYEGLGALPLFNPDIEGPEYERPAPAPVAHLRAHLRAADGVVIASPEYAHGISAVMKNALDWVVGSGEVVGKPVAILNASPRAHHAWDALREVLSVMDSILIDEASVTVPILGSKLDAAGIVDHADIAKVLTMAMGSFVDAIRGMQTARD